MQIASCGEAAQTAAEQLKASVVSYVDEAVAAASAAHERAVRAIGNGGGGLNGVHSSGGELHQASAAVATVADAAVRAMVAELTTWRRAWQSEVRTGSGTTKVFVNAK
eukprot:5700702-Pleurochrysis_carterae.AAC.3